MTSFRKITDSETPLTVPAGLGLSPAVQVGNMLYLCGIVGFEKDIKELERTGTVQQARTTLRNIGLVLETAGSSFSKVVKTTVLLADINDFPAVNEVYKEFFKEPYPARVSYQVGNLPMNAKVEIDAIAVVGDIETIT